MRTLIPGLFLLAAASFVSAANHTVNVNSSSFSPANLSIQAGDSVTWVNRFDASHTITSSSVPPAWGEDFLFDEGEQVTIFFNSPGTFPYRCRLHIGMTGTITVSSAGPALSVVLAAPSSGAVIAADDGIALMAEAAGESIVSVEFFANGQSLGTDQTAPYELTASGLAPGSYNLTATVTGSPGGSASSSPVAITVVNPVAIVLSSPRFVGGVFQFDMTANAGLTYIVEGSEGQGDLFSFVPITTFAATGASVAVNDPEPRSGRFYRVRRIKGSGHAAH